MSAITAVWFGSLQGTFIVLALLLLRRARFRCRMSGGRIGCRHCSPDGALAKSGITRRSLSPGFRKSSIRATSAPRSLPDRLQDLHQLAVDVVVAGDDVAGLENLVAAFDVGDEAAGLAHQHHARGHVP